MAAFNLASSTSASETPTPLRYNSESEGDEYDEDDLSTLPFPSALPRSAFLNPGFDPQTYLSTLHNRHQTLEDLRSDLRQRSQLLSRELLDLVNGNYEEFLSLGGDLKGGGEKVEGVKVGVLGFEREVQGIRKGVQERVDEAGRLIEERKSVRADVVLGRALLAVEEALVELEEMLGIRERETDEEADEDSDDDVDESATDSGASPAGTGAIPLHLKRLRRYCDSYLLIIRKVDRIGPSHAFLVTLQPRIAEVRKTVLLDLAAALRQTKSVKEPDHILALVKMYADLGADREGVRVLKGG